MIITAGKFKGQKIIAPNEKITRPTLSKVRMSVFNILFSLVGDFTDKTLLDVFGGSGIIGLEALSRGFLCVDVFEINKKAAQIITQNYSKFGLKPNLTIGDSTELIKTTNKKYDIYYLDPPYESGIYENILQNINSGIVVAEHNKDFDLCGFKLLRQKDYGDTILSVLTK